MRRRSNPITFNGTFAAWRAHARVLLATHVPPHAVAFNDTDDTSVQPGLFTAAAQPTPVPDLPADARVPNVSKRFVELAQRVALHRDREAKWPLLYRTLWRMTRGDEPHVLSIASDPDVRRLDDMRRQVGRDAHKMHAFVRFREVQETRDDGTPVTRYVAFHRPEHLIVRREAAWFKRRFPVMAFSLLTPDACAHWDPVTKQMTFGQGVDASAAAQPDDVEALWLTYYAHIFNPARIKLKAMVNEMPRKHWPTLPETRLIPDLLADAPRRLKEMEQYNAKNANSGAAFFPTGTGPFTLPQLAAAATACRGCELCGPATQTVFGRGQAEARLVFVGEQPGDQEDQAGEPFVGPAGQKLSVLLEQAGIDRSAAYLTNVVKHFRFEPQDRDDTQRGTRRIHAKPLARHVNACRPWLEAELDAIRPSVIVALGATAARALFGSTFKITHQRGAWTRTRWSERCLATFHPSALLRAQGPRAEDMQAQMLADLRAVAVALGDD